MISVIAKGLLIPFLGTALGSACVFFMKKEMSPKLQKALSGFAAGAMLFVDDGSVCCVRVVQHLLFI